MKTHAELSSQSLCSRDKFSMMTAWQATNGHVVAIPLQQGQVFNSEGCFFSLFSIGCEGYFQLFPTGKS